MKIENCKLKIERRFKNSLKKFGCLIENCIIENSMKMENCKLKIDRRFTNFYFIKVCYNNLMEKAK